MANDVHSFRHDAMNTWFEISIVGKDADYARKAATEAFLEIDRLENLLSRFREGSDIDILNKRASKEPVRVTEETRNCMLQALDLEILTGGVFSIAFEALMDSSLFDGDPLLGTWLEMDAANHTVFFKYPDLKIDLGGIGKGYALDLVVKHLEDWDIDSLLIHSGTSSVVARGSRDGLEGWPISVGADICSKDVFLSNESMSGSSLAVQDSHILKLKSQEILDTERRTWAWASSGAISDALSTSFMVMDVEAIRGVCEAHSGIGALIIDPDRGNSQEAFGSAVKRL